MRIDTNLMRIFALVALTMCAFAANSVLNRIGVARLDMDPMDFAMIRTGAGAAMLWLLITLRHAPRPAVLTPRRFAGALALAVYMIGFSWAYLTLDAGLGALILFGMVQIVIFGWSVLQRASIPLQRWIGAFLALIGLCVLLWPSTQVNVSLSGACAMAAAGSAWAAYTLLGQGEADPLGATSSNFLLCFPLVGIVAIAAGIGDLQAAGIATAIIAGTLTSGLGYALWYYILPALPTTVSGIAQLSVPVIAIIAGVAFLGEPFTPRIGLAGALVLGGIAFSLIVPRKIS